jgi:hypothetical protein
MTYTLSQVTESVGTITLDHERRRNTGLPLGSFTRTTARSLSHHGRAQVVRSLPSVARPQNQPAGRRSVSLPHSRAGVLWEPSPGAFSTTCLKKDLTFDAISGARWPLHLSTALT